MSTIQGVEAYVMRTLQEEKQCHREILALVDAQAYIGGWSSAAIFEKVTKLRNISRDLGWMRRLLADMRKEKGWNEGA